MRTTFTSESVTEGHPDKMADQISDAVLDAMLEGDPASRVACETLLTTGLVVVAGEVTTSTYVDIPALVRDTVCDIGYDNDAYGFNGRRAACWFPRRAVAGHRPGRGRGLRVAKRQGGRRRAQRPGRRRPGMMFGYACDETPDLMPLPIWLAHRLSERLAQVRRPPRCRTCARTARPRSRVVYEDGRPVRIDTVLISTQHAAGIDLEEQLRPDLTEHVINPLLPTDLDTEGLRILVNPTGIFELGGPHADTGLTGRKIIVDTYGGMARHGGGAFSGKDPSKVDRSAAYAAAGWPSTWWPPGAAKRCEVQVAYAIGVAHPVSLLVETSAPRRSIPRRSLTRARAVRPAPGRHHRATSTCAARSTGRRRPTATSAARRRNSPGKPPRGSRTCGTPWGSERTPAPLRGSDAVRR